MSSLAKQLAAIRRIANDDPVEGMEWLRRLTCPLKMPHQETVTNGFTVEPVPSGLRKLLGLPKVSITRFQVIQLLHQYVEEHSLYNAKTGDITPDKAMTRAMNIHGQVTYYNLSVWVRHCYD